MAETPTTAELQRIVEAGKLATERPWFRDSCSIASAVSQGTSPQDRGLLVVDVDAVTYFDSDYIAIAANSADKLAAERLRIGEILGPELDEEFKASESRTYIVGAEQYLRLRLTVEKARELQRLLGRE